MATQAEVEAGAEALKKEFDEFVPAMFRDRITGDMEFNLALKIINAAEAARKKPKSGT